MFFMIYSFFGWFLETAFASALEKRYINRGFLIGPFTPIYGFGAILIIFTLNSFDFSNQQLFIKHISFFIFSTLLMTLLEFITGIILEKIFHSKWWDYSKNAYNFKGYVCLKYSLIWGGLSFLLIQIVHPIIQQMVHMIPDAKVEFIIILFILYFVFDTLISVIGALDLRKVILHYSDISVELYKEKILKYKRFFFAFPKLLILNAHVFNHDIRSILYGRIDKIKVEFKNRFLN